jgi:hypothetical protein
MERLSAAFGLTAVGLFGLALTVFATLNPCFHPLDDYVSKLGALGQPYAPWWNVIGFLIVGALPAGFGLRFGRVVDDRLVGGLLAAFGVGFGATGFPVDWAHQQAPVSKAHVVAICLGLAAWLFGLARLAYLPGLGRSVQLSANVAAGLVVLPILAQVAGLVPMPLTHRLVFGVVFGWVAFTSIALLRDRTRPSDAARLQSGRMIDEPSREDRMR